MQTLEKRILEVACKIYRSSLFTACNAEGMGTSASLPIQAHPDNIAYGGLGKYFFALELYRRSGDPQIMEDLLLYVSVLEEYRQTVKTNNYSFFLGRSGVVFFYLQLYRLTQKEEFLRRSLEIVREYISPDQCHLQIFDHSGLVDGTAGTLLVFLHLYRESQEPWLLDYIKKSIRTLTDKAILTKWGISWSTPHRGKWACGNTGIAFAFLQLSDYFRNEPLRALAIAALSHEQHSDCPSDECLMDPSGCESPPGCTEFNGWDQPGGHLVRLYAAYNGSGAVKEDLSTFRPDELIASLSEYRPPVRESLTEGKDQEYFRRLNELAGWGLAFKEAFVLTKDSAYCPVFKKIASLVTARLELVNIEKQGYPGFFNGLTGIGYLLLKCMEQQPAPSLLLPSLPAAGGCKYEAQPAEKASDIAGWSPINRSLLRKNFKEISIFLETEFPEDLALRVGRPGVLQAPALFEWAKTKENGKLLRGETLTELVARAEALYELRNSGLFPGRRDDAVFAEKLEKILQWPDHVLLSAEVRPSGEVFVYKVEPDVDLERPIPDGLLQSFFTTYGNKSYHIGFNNYDEPEEGCLRILRLFADLFREPAVVQMAAEKMIKFILCQREEVISVFMQKSDARDKDHLRRLITDSVTAAVRKLMVIGVLTADL